MSSILIIYLRTSLHKKKYLMLLLKILLQVIMSPHTPPFLWETNCFYPVRPSIIKVCTCNYSYLDFVRWNSLRLFMLVYYHLEIHIHVYCHHGLIRLCLKELWPFLTLNIYNSSNILNRISLKLCMLAYYHMEKSILILQSKVKVELQYFVSVNTIFDNTS